MRKDRSCVGIVSFLTALAVVLSLTAGPALAQVRKSERLVKVDVAAGKPNSSGLQAVNLTLSIDKGWHLYANPVGLEDLASSQTTLQAGPGVKLVAVQYPEGKLIKDKTLGDYKTYEDRATIKATIQRPADSSQPAELVLKFQACDAKTCLPPASVKVTVPAE